jgi:ubiquinone/menaquinone biosynthesis C-methylase UbiE
VKAADLSTNPRPATFGRLASTYEVHRPVTAADRLRLRLMLERCPVPAAGAVLEIGCGTGRLLRALQGMAQLGRATGIDPEPEMLARASTLEVHLGRAENLPVASEAFHLAFSWLAFHHVEDKAAAAREMVRVLRPGGHAAIWTLTPEHVRRFHLNAYFPSLTTVDLPRFQAPERWMTLLVDAGFDPVVEQQIWLRRTTTAARLAAAVRDRYLSTFDLLPEDEFEAGARRLEAEARREPGRRITYDQVWCLVWGRRP